jgi:peptidoglycan/LPS O-acetylase OafA/YrhL
LITSAPDFNFNASGPFNLVVFRPTMILIGCLIALNRESLEKRVSQSVTSALLIFVALVAATILWQFPPLAGIATGLLILLISDTAAHKSRTAKFLKRALSLKPLAWIGVLSYSIYIWHLPMIYWNSNHFMNQWLDTSIPVFFLMLIAVSAGSFYLFEKPLLKFLTKRSKV